MAAGILLSFRTVFANSMLAPTAPTLTQPLQLSNTTSNSALWRHRVIVGPVSTQIDLRSTKDPVAILKDPLQTSHPKVEQICCKNMLLISNDAHCSELAEIIQKV